MDSNQFDDLTRLFGESASRRNSLRSIGGAALGGILALAGLARAEAGKKKKKKKKKKGERCGSTTCGKGKFCCDDSRKVCCTKGGECCNPGPGTGSCCDQPNRCGLPIGNDAAPRECCPPERQWFTSVGLVRCCPPGKRALQGITSDDGACCPEDKYCGDNNCCADGLVCADSATGRCCTAADVCGSTCCRQSACLKCVGGSCEDQCSGSQVCQSGTCVDLDCGRWGCGG